MTNFMVNFYAHISSWLEEKIKICKHEKINAKVKKKLSKLYNYERGIYNHLTTALIKRTFRLKEMFISEHNMTQ